MRNYENEMAHEIHALRTSQRWASLLIVVVVVAAAGGLLWVVDHYFGEGGARVLLVAVGIIGIVVLVYALTIVVSAVYGRMAMNHHNNILDGLVNFQRADDYGEVARSVANNMGGVLRSGNSLDGRILTIANQLARQQSQALLAAERGQQRQLEQSAQADWYNVNATFDDEIPVGWDQAGGR